MAVRLSAPSRGQRKQDLRSRSSLDAISDDGFSAPTGLYRASTCAGTGLETAPDGRHRVPRPTGPEIDRPRRNHRRDKHRLSRPRSVSQPERGCVTGRLGRTFINVLSPSRSIPEHPSLTPRPHLPLPPRPRHGTDAAREADRVPPHPGLVRWCVCAGEEEPGRCCYYNGYSLAAVQSEEGRFQGCYVRDLAPRARQHSHIWCSSEELLLEIFKVCFAVLHECRNHI